MMKRPVRIANISGFFGDRPSALREQLEGGEVDVVSGDYLAELTMLILARTRSRRPDGGYARTFVAALEDSLETIVERGVKVVVNAGGLDPTGAADAIRTAVGERGLSLVVAAISGDDLVDRLPDLQAAGEQFINLQTGKPLGALTSSVVTANAYMGGWGITEALRAGADIIVTGRVADASVVSGPAAWWHDWNRDDYDQLAGAVAAGHIIECGMQATGGNYSFFKEVPDMAYPGFPWADIAGDGSSIIGKHSGTGGEVSIGTVVSQLLYEIGPPAYLSPDVISRFDTVSLEQAGPDRVSLTGTRGEPPPRTLKVAAAIPGGFRNSLMIGLTGMDADAKAALLSEQMWRQLPWTRDDYDDVQESVVGRGSNDPSSNESAVSFWRIAAASTDENKVGRSFSNAGISILLGSIPGMFSVSPPGPATAFARYWPTTIDRSLVTQKVELSGVTLEVSETETQPSEPVSPVVPDLPAPPTGPIRQVQLGTIYGARSGDKGGIANIGVFARSAEAYVWLADSLTVDRLRKMMPDVADLPIDRFDLPNLWSLNFVLHGFLGEGVSSSLRLDAQAKGLAEYLRACPFPIPVELLPVD